LRPVFEGLRDLGHPPPRTSKSRHASYEGRV
jgi:hypothetical protein